MRNNIVTILIVVLFLFVSCSSVSENNMDYKDEYLNVVCNIDYDEGKLFDLLISNKSDEEIVLVFAESKVSNADGDLVNFISKEEALSSNKIININNITLNPNEGYNNQYMALGYIRKQILKNEIVLIPWINKGEFYLELPYIVNGKKHYIKVNK